jgi:hypothetical protein
MNFVAGRLGSAIGGKAFNSNTSSCDVYNKQGKPCCTMQSEATKKNMPYCGPRELSKMTDSAGPPKAAPKPTPKKK